MAFSYQRTSPPCCFESRLSRFIGDLIGANATADIDVDKSTKAVEIETKISQGRCNRGSNCRQSRNS